MYRSVFQWDTSQPPAPQPLSADELKNVCRSLKGAGFAQEGIYHKMEILRNYAEAQRRKGKRTITITTK